MDRYSIQATIQAVAVWAACIFSAFYGVPLAFGSLMNTRIAHSNSCNGAVLRHDAAAFRHFLTSGILDTCQVPSQGVGPYHWMAWASIALIIAIAVGFTIYSVVAGPVEAFGENILVAIFMFCVVVTVLMVVLIYMIFVAMFIMIAIVIGIGFGATRD